jgi:hypothetical protein
MCGSKSGSRISDPRTPSTISTEPDSGLWCLKGVLSGPGCGKHGAPTSRLSQVLQADGLDLLRQLCHSLYGQETEHYESAGYRGNRKIISTPGTSEAFTLIPLPPENQLRFVTQMLHRVTLYSTLTVMTVDLEISDGYISYSGGNRKSWSNFWPILKYNAEYRNLVDQGRCIFLPYRSSYLEESTSSTAVDTSAAPMNQRADSIKFTPVNPTTLRPGASPLDDLLVYEHVILPYFPAADLADVADIAEKETDSFIIFNQFLAEKLGQIAQSSSVMKISDLLGEIHAGAAELRIEAKKVERSKILRGAEAGVFVVSLSALLAVGGHAAETVAGIAGTVSLIELIREWVAGQNEKLDLKKSAFYIPYLLSKA